MSKSKQEMTKDDAEKTLIEFMQEKTARTWALKGTWGCGKTCLWNKLYDDFHEHIHSKYKYYVYISLFEVESIQSLRENLVVGRKKIERKSNEPKNKKKLNLFDFLFLSISSCMLFYSLLILIGDFSELVNWLRKLTWIESNGFSGIKISGAIINFIFFITCGIYPFFILKKIELHQFIELIKAIPRYGPMIGASLQMSLESTVENSPSIFICFDDLERCPPEMTDHIMGLIISLRDERKCKILLIFNEEKLQEEMGEDKDGKQDDNKKRSSIFKKYRRKVINKEIDFKPSFSNSVDIAYKNIYKKDNSQEDQEMDIAQHYLKENLLSDVIHFKKNNEGASKENSYSDKGFEYIGNDESLRVILSFFDNFNDVMKELRKRDLFEIWKKGGKCELNQMISNLALCCYIETQYFLMSENEELKDQFESAEPQKMNDCFSNLSPKTFNAIRQHTAPFCRSVVVTEIERQQFLKYISWLATHV